MLDFLFGKERKLYGELSQAVQSAQEQHGDPRRQIELSTTALELCDRIQKWPWEHPSRRLIKGTMLHCLGRAYGNLASVDPQRNLRLARSYFDSSLQFLEPSDGSEWKHALVNAATALCERIEGDGDDEARQAKARFDQVLGVLDQERDAPMVANTLVTLASLALRNPNSLNQQELSLARDRLRQARTLLDRMEKDDHWINTSSLLGQGLAEFPSSFDPATEQEAMSVLEPLIRDYRERMHSDQVAGCCNSLMSCHWAASSRVGHDATRQSHIDRAFAYAKLGSDVAHEAGNLTAWGQLQFAAARLYAARRDGNLRSHREAALKCLRNALEVFTPEQFPLLHTEVRDFYLSVKAEKLSGGEVSDREALVRHLEAELRGVDKEREPASWAFAAEKLASALTLNNGLGQSEALERAIVLYKDALHAVDRDVHAPFWCNVTSNLATTYARRLKGDPIENFEHAVTLHRRALEHIDRRQSMDEWAHVMRDLALTYKDSPIGSPADNNEQAICLLEETLVFVDGGLNPLGRALTLESAADAYKLRARGNERANLERSVGLFEEARRNFSEAGDEAGLNRLTPKLTNALFRLNSRGSQERDAQSSESQTDTGAFFSRLERTVSEVDRAVDTVTWFQATLTLADAHTRVMRRQPRDDEAPNAVQTQLLRQVLTATEILSDAAEFLEPTEYRDQLRLARRRLADYFLLQCLLLDWMEYESDLEGCPVPPEFDQMETDRLVEQAIGLRTQVLASHPAEGNREQYLRDALALAEAYTRRSQWTDALNLYESLVPLVDALLTDVEASEAGTIQVLEILSAFASEGPALAMETGNPEAALVLAESGRARLLAKSISLRSYYRDTDLATQLVDIQSRVRELEGKLADPRTLDRGTPLDEVIGLRKELTRLTARSDSSQRDFTATVRQGIQKACARGLTLVFPFQSSNSGHLIVAFPDGNSYELTTVKTPSFATLSSRMPSGEDRADDDLETKQKFLLRSRMALRAKLGIVAHAQARIGDWFAQPLTGVLEALPKRAGRRVVVFPYGLLGNFALGTGLIDSSTPLIDRYELSFSPSIDALSSALSATTQGPARVCAVVNNELLASGLEAAAIQTFLKPGDLRRCDSSSSDVASVRQALESTNIWHFATHGRFSPGNLTASGLQVNGDDWISIDELKAVANVESPSLVILSACVSGLYGVNALPNEYIGLPSVFMQLGASGVIASLWPVNEVPTALLFCKFYERYAENGNHGPSALREAQLWLRGARTTDLQSMVRRLVGSNGISEEAGERVSTAIERSAPERRTKSGEAPYRSALYWGSFVYYGA